MTGRALVSLAALAGALAVAAGMWLIGSPATARERSLDDKRAADLSAIARAVQQYRWSNQRMPAALNDLAPERAAGLRDPITTKPYEYSVRKGDSYELCAVFQQPSSGEGFEQHQIGRHCFSRRVSPKPF